MVAPEPRGGNMKAQDIIALLEYKNAFPKTRRKKEKDLSDLNLSEILVKLQERQARIKADMEAIEKLMKKDDKKKEDKKLNPVHIAMWLLATSPITGPLMLLYWAKIFSAIQMVH